MSSERHRVDNHVIQRRRIEYSMFWFGGPAPAKQEQLRKHQKAMVFTVIC